MVSIGTLWGIRNLTSAAIVIALMAAVLMVGINPAPALADCVDSNTGPIGECAEAGAVPFSAGVVTGEQLSTFFAAAITPIPQPNLAYTTGTTLIDISGLTNFTLHPSITDGTQTVTFTTTLDKRQVPGGGWATWDSPPFTEGNTPHVLFSTAQTQDLTLSLPSKTVGFELEPNVFGIFSSTADFYSGGCAGTLEGSITQLVDGNAGARLFAAQTQAGPINCVKITVAPGSSGFAIAQVRYALDRTPPKASCEPGTNPAGKNDPNAPGKGGQGQNQDGFYQLFGSDDIAVASIVIRDSGSPFVSLPFASGDTVKVTQAPGATPGEKRPGPGVIVSHLTLKGDAILKVTDTSGNVTEVKCLVPPPPK